MGDINDVSSIFANFSRFKYESFHDIPSAISNIWGNTDVGEDDYEPPKDRSSYDDTFLGKLFCLEHWFLRCSWANKHAFLRKLNFVIHENRDLPKLIFQIDRPTKDMLYGSSQYTNTIYDITPIDYNRCFTLEESVQIEDSFLKWIRSILPHLQIQVYCALLKLSGSALSRAAYKDISEILIPEMGSSLTYYSTDTMAQISTISQRVFSDTSQISRFSTMSVAPEKKDKKKKKPYMKERKMIQREFSDSQYYKKFTHLMNKWVDLEKSLKDRAKMKSVVAAERHGGKKGKGNSGGIDALQLMPIWVNKKIVSLLKPKDKAKMAKVSDYWKGVVKDVNKEMAGRKHLDKYINSLEIKHGLKTPKKGTGKSTYRKTKAKSRPTTAPNARRRPIKSLASRSPMTANALHPKREKGVKITESPYVPQREKIESILEKNDKYEYAYNWRHKVIGISTRFVQGRRISSKKKWIASVDGRDIKFHNMITGAPFPYALRTLDTCLVTFVALHKTEDIVYVGGQDGTLTSWGIWSQKVKTRYTGDKGSITSISVWKDHLATISADSYVKLYDSKVQEPIWYSHEFSTPSCIHLVSSDLLFFGNVYGQLFKVNVTCPSDNQVIMNAHFEAVSCIKYRQGLLFSGGIDTFVRVWNGETLNSFSILSLKHPASVSAVEFSLQKVITGCHDGKLRIWDIFTGKIVRKIDIEVDKSPILQINCIDDKDHSKIVVNTHANVKVCEFPKKFAKKIAREECKMPSKSTVKKPLPLIVRKRASDIEGARELLKRNNALTREEQRLGALVERMATLPSIRTSVDPLTQKESIIPPLLIDGARSFDREGKGRPLHEIKKEELLKQWEEAEKARKKEEEDALLFGKKKQKSNYFSYKAILPIYNPYKFLP